MKQEIKVRLVGKNVKQHTITNEGSVSVNRQVTDIAVLLCLDATQFEKLPKVEVVYNGVTHSFNMVKDAAKLSFTLLLEIGKVLFSNVTTFEGRTEQSSNPIALAILVPFKYKEKTVSYEAYTKAISVKFSGLKTLVKHEQNKAAFLDTAFNATVSIAKIANSEYSKIAKGAKEIAAKGYAAAIAANRLPVATA